jgi:signal transduction histidine kinase
MRTDNNFNSQGSSRHYSLQGLRILIVDDDAGLCNSLKFFFEDHECLVTTSNNAEEGLELFNEIKPEVILVDLNMPGTGGHNLVENIAGKHPHIPIIVVSGVGIIKEAIRSINLGAWDFIPKPIINFEDLELSVYRALDKSSLIKENNKYKQELEKIVESKTAELTQKNIELEKLITECKKAKEKAEESEQLKTEFLAQMSHEIRTPLFQITGYTDIAKSSLEKGDISDTFTCFEEIKTASDRIIRTFELIISMSELKLGIYKPKFEIQNLASLVEGKVIDYLSKVRNKNLNFSFKNDCQNSNVQIDKLSVEQIIENLLNNAVKFTLNGAILVRMFCYDHKVNVEIADTGIGISDDYMKKMYKPFTQEKQGYDRTYEGNGLGLAITKKYCDLNNADLRIDSKKGFGTKVKIIFEQKNIQDNDY